MLKEKEVRLNFDFDEDDLDLNDSPLPKIWVIPDHNDISKADEEIFDFINEFQFRSQGWG